MLNLLRQNEPEDEDGSTSNHYLKHMALSVYDCNSSNNIAAHNSAPASGAQSQQFYHSDLPQSANNSNTVYPGPSSSGVKRNADYLWSAPIEKRVTNKVAEGVNTELSFIQVNKHLMLRHSVQLKKIGSPVGSRVLMNYVNAKAAKILKKQLENPDEYPNFICGTEGAKEYFKSHGDARLVMAHDSAMLGIPEGWHRPSKHVLYCGRLKGMSHKSKGCIFYAYLDPSLDDEVDSTTKLIRLPNNEVPEIKKCRYKIFGSESTSNFKIDLKTSVDGEVDKEIYLLNDASYDREVANTDVEDEHPYMSHIEANKHLGIRPKLMRDYVNVPDWLLKHLVEAKATKILKKQVEKPVEYSNFLCGTDHTKGCFTNGGVAKVSLMKRNDEITMIPRNLFRPNDHCVLFIGTLETSNGVTGSIAAYLDPRLDDEDDSITKLVSLPVHTAEIVDDSTEIPSITVFDRLTASQINVDIIASVPGIRHEDIFSLSAGRNHGQPPIPHAPPNEYNNHGVNATNEGISFDIIMAEGPPMPAGYIPFNDINTDDDEISTEYLIEQIQYPFTAENFATSNHISTDDYNAPGADMYTSGIYGQSVYRYPEYVQRLTGSPMYCAPVQNAPTIPSSTYEQPVYNSTYGDASISYYDELEYTTDDLVSISDEFNIFDLLSEPINSAPTSESVPQQFFNSIELPQSATNPSIDIPGPSSSDKQNRRCTSRKRGEQRRRSHPKQRGVIKTSVGEYIGHSNCNEVNKNLRIRKLKNENCEILPYWLMVKLVGIKATKILEKQFAKPEKYKNFISGTDLFIKALIDNTGGYTGVLKLPRPNAKLNKVIIPDMVKPKDHWVLFFANFWGHDGTVYAIAAYLDPELDDEDDSITKLVSLPNTEAEKKECLRRGIVTPDLYSKLKFDPISSVPSLKNKELLLFDDDYTGDVINTVAGGDDEISYVEANKNLRIRNKLTGEYKQLSEDLLIALVDAKATKILKKQLNEPETYSKFICGTDKSLNVLQTNRIRSLWIQEKFRSQNVPRDFKPPTEDCVLYFGRFNGPSKRVYSIAVYLDPRLDDEADSITKLFSFPKHNIGSFSRYKGRRVFIPEETSQFKVDPITVLPMSENEEICLSPFDN